MDGLLAYTVRHLLEARRVQGTLQFPVDWEGYSPKERTWVPARDILDTELIRDFNQLRGGRPGSAAGAAPRRGATVKRERQKEQTGGQKKE